MFPFSIFALLISFDLIIICSFPSPQNVVICQRIGTLAPHGTMNCVYWYNHLVLLMRKQKPWEFPWLAMSSFLFLHCLEPPLVAYFEDWFNIVNWLCDLVWMVNKEQFSLPFVESFKNFLQFTFSNFIFLHTYEAWIKYFIFKCTNTVMMGFF